MTPEQIDPIEKVRQYFNRLSLADIKGGGLRMASIYLAQTAGYEHVENTFRPTFKHAKHILIEVESDLAAWEAMSLMTKHYVKNGLPLTPEMSDFITRMIDGDITKPKKSANKWKTLDRDLPIAMGVYILNEEGYTIEDAAAEVADILKDMGIEKAGDSMVVKIWNRHKEHVKNTQEQGPWYHWHNAKTQESPLKK